MSQESLFFCDEKPCQGVTVGALQEKLIAHLGSHTLKEVRFILAIFWSILAQKIRAHLRAFVLYVLLWFWVVGWKVGITFLWSQPPGDNKNNLKVESFWSRFLTSICDVLGLLGVLQGFLKVLRFWGFRFWGLKKLKSRQVILTSEGKNMNKFFQDSMSLVAYIKHSCIHQAHISGHLIVVCLWTWSLLPSTNT